MNKVFDGERPIASVTLNFRDGTSHVIEVNDTFVEAAGFYVSEAQGVPDGTTSVYHALGLIWTEDTHEQE